MGGISFYQGGVKILYLRNLLIFFSNFLFINFNLFKPIDMIGYSNWREGFPDNTHFYAAMRQTDAKWSTGIGKASLKFLCFKKAEENLIAQGQK